MQPQFLEIAVVTKPHGLRGQLRVKLFTEGHDFLADLSTLALRFPDGHEETRRIEQLAPGSSGMWRLQLEGCRSREAAEALRGVTLWADRAALPPLDPAEFYLADVVGREARSAAGETIGRVEAIGDNGAQPLLIIRGDGCRYNVPVVPELVRDFDGEWLTLELPDGLLEAVAERLREDP